VDLPAVSPDHPVPWLVSTLETADAALLVVDLGDPACLEQVALALTILRAQRVTLSDRWEATVAPAVAVSDDPFALRLPTLLLANKADRPADTDADLRVFLEVLGLPYPALAVSASTGHGLGKIGPWLFDHLGIVRVYTKVPGRPPDLDRPFTLRRGQTVEDVAELVHKDIAQSLKYARVWGKSGFDGQHVGRHHPVADGDAIELHV
jgi:50S ribosomal subunit-associated GTPase HflX